MECSYQGYSNLSEYYAKNNSRKIKKKEELSSYYFTYLPQKMNIQFLHS
nr:MAG TPA: hypothetical protein [Caudoviricetes sp.]